MKKSYRWYYHQMDRLHQSVYDTLLAGFTELAPSIRIPRLDIGDLSTLFFQLRLDNPMIFYLVSFTVRAYPQADHVEFVPEYLFEKNKIKAHQQALQSRITRVLRPAEKLKPEEKEEYIHDFILRNVTYDKLEKPYSHEIIGTLTNGVGVCEGIAKTVKLFCDELGIDCMVAICDNDRANGVKYRHAWNILKLNGKWYHLDVTFDNSLSRCGLPRYDYYNVDDSQIFRDHRPLLYPAPACSDHDNFYYKTKHLSWTKTEDAGKRARQALRKKQSAMVFHWRGGYLTREVLLQLAQELVNAADEKEKSVRLSVNWPMAVIFVRFEEKREELAVETENPDEGESL